MRLEDVTHEAASWIDTDHGRAPVVPLDSAVDGGEMGAAAPTTLVTLLSALLVTQTFPERSIETLPFGELTVE